MAHQFAIISLKVGIDRKGLHPCRPVRRQQNSLPFKRNWSDVRLRQVRHESFVIEDQLAFMPALVLECIMSDIYKYIAGLGP